jgi:short-subunit dehydrogenase
MDIRGSKILLTGASGGLGEAIARDLAGRGAELVLTARSEQVLEDLAEQTGGEVQVADLADRNDLERLCGLLGDVDVLVANAGIGGYGAVSETSVDQIDRVLDVNLRAPMVLATEFAHRRIEAGRPGQVVMMGSLSGVVATTNSALYNGTKFGLRGYTLAIRQDLEPHGIGVSLVAPGFIDTAGMFAENDIELPSVVRTRSPQDVAAGVRKAIEANPAEVYVSPPELRLAATLGGVAAGLSGAIQRRFGVADMTGGR